MVNAVNVYLYRPVKQIVPVPKEGHPSVDGIYLVVPLPGPIGFEFRSGARSCIVAYLSIDLI